MKRLPENQFQYAEDDEDDDFLAQVAAVESQALSHSKRFKSTLASAPTTAPANTSRAYSVNQPKETNQATEGAYLAALRGIVPQRSNFGSAQSRVVSSGSRLKVVTADGGGDQLGAVTDGACFKCGKSGHWARDCDSAKVGDGMQQPSEPEKTCQCGSGICIVLTANTERNKGRRFYKCPIRQEQGGCNFFEWCDSPSGNAMTNTNYTNNAMTNVNYTNNVMTNTNYTNNAMTNTNYTNNGSNTFPDLACPCNAGSCLVLTAKTGKNVGQQFYRCPANQANSCGFFKWCNDQTTAAKASIDTNSRTTYSAVSGGSSSSCFKCGKEGHWARDCSSSSYEPHSGFNTKSSSATPSNSCYKCGKAGHWAKDCLQK